MSRFFAKVAVGVGLLALFTGCVEMTQTITLNPDGRGKVKIEIVTAAYDFDFGAALGAPMEKKAKSLDDIKRDTIGNFLSDTPGVTAFKDVTVDWTREGKLKMVATAYFNKLEDLAKDEMAPQDPTKVQPANSFQSDFKVTIDKKGTMRITAKNPGIEKGAKPFDISDPMADPAKMSDKELDEYLLKQRVEYQKAKPMLELMFNDLKLKTVLHLPGDVAEVKGFVKDGPRTVSQTIEGKEFLALFKKVVMMEPKEFKKLSASKDQKDLAKLLGPLAVMGEPDVTVGNMGKAQFDYDKELKEARAAYPSLREKLRLDPKVKLPGD